MHEHRRENRLLGITKIFQVYLWSLCQHVYLFKSVTKYSIDPENKLYARAFEKTSLTYESAECCFMFVKFKREQAVIWAAERNQRQTGGEPYIFTASFHNT